VVKADIRVQCGLVAQKHVDELQMRNVFAEHHQAKPSSGPGKHNPIRPTQEGPNAEETKEACLGRR